MQFSEPIPKKIISWQLKGDGLKEFGNNSNPDELPFPKYTEDDVVARVDVVGICFSDVKLVRAGSAHPRLKGRDLSSAPVTPGHEVALTIVGVGDRWKHTIRLGARYIVQPDVYYNQTSLGIGYQLAGGFSQFIILGPEVIAGDEGCYLVEIPDNIGSVEAALIEPWTCVMASYQIEPRTHILSDGVLCFYGFPGQPQLDLRGIEFGGNPDRLGSTVPRSCSNPSKHKEIAYSGLTKKNSDLVERWAKEIGVSLVSELSEDTLVEADDIVVLGVPSNKDWLSQVFENCRRYGAIAVLTKKYKKVSIPVDIGRIHYQGIRLVSIVGGYLSQAYHSATRCDLLQNGNTWFVGGGGPMGQMHVLRALSKSKPPAKVVVTDLDKERLTSLSARVRALGLPLPILLSANLDYKTLEKELKRNAPLGFSDIVVMAPSGEAVEHSANFLAQEGYLNVFAGVPEGTIIKMPLEKIIMGARIAGSSGSPLSIMKKTVQMVADKKISPAIMLGALADMKNGKKALKAVWQNTITGKVVILPFAQDIGFEKIAEIKGKYSQLAALLSEGSYWSNEAEELLIEKGCIIR